MSISAPRDANRVVTLMVTSNADGVTPILVKVNPSNNGVKAIDGTTGSSFASTDAQRDDNRIVVAWGVSSADGTTPIPIYGDPTTGSILIKST